MCRVSKPTDDKANLEYSKRATDLALEHLRHQLKDGQPDQDLLDRLGWSKDDLQKMLARWEKMQARSSAARGAGTEGEGQTSGRTPQSRIEKSASPPRRKLRR